MPLPDSCSHTTCTQNKIRIHTNKKKLCNRGSSRPTPLHAPIAKQVLVSTEQVRWRGRPLGRKKHGRRISIGTWTEEEERGGGAGGEEGLGSMCTVSWTAPKNNRLAAARVPVRSLSGPPVAISWLATTKISCPP